MKFIAHRGYSNIAPENSIKAFELAANEEKFSAIECDIYTTKDGEFVVFHDLTLTRMTKNKAQITDLTYEELSLLELKAGRNIKKYPNQKIPKLTEFLDICANSNKIAVIEIKKVNDVSNLIDLINLIDNYNSLEVIIISFNLNYLKFLRAVTTVELHYLVEKVTNEIIYEARVNQLDLSVKYKNIDEKLVKKLRKANFKIAVWNINSSDEIKKTTKLGVDYLTTGK